MQATGSLSLEQKSTLESVFLVFRTTPPLLRLLAGKLDRTEQLQLEGVVRILQNGQERLVAHFPELLSFAEEWKKRGGL